MSQEFDFQAAIVVSVVSLLGFVVTLSLALVEQSAAYAVVAVVLGGIGFATGVYAEGVHSQSKYSSQMDVLQMSQENGSLKGAEKDTECDR